MSAGGSVLPTRSKEAEFGKPLNTKSPPSKAMGRGVGTGKIFNLAECPGGFVISCPGHEISAHVLGALCWAGSGLVMEAPTELGHPRA